MYLQMRLLASFFFFLSCITKKDVLFYTIPFSPIMDLNLKYIICCIFDLNFLKETVEESIDYFHDSVDLAFALLMKGQACSISVFPHIDLTQTSTSTCLPSTESELRN